MRNKPRVIAFYLPQFHPIPENDEWWGKGFTEWTNVGKAKPLFPGHYQPRVPADLGYYDLRVPEVREEQARLAKEAGIEGFCYYHYWFGSKNTPRELLQMPFNEVVKTGTPDFPFCLCWANHSWAKNDWNSEISIFDKTILVEQKYYGIEDYTEHFYSLLDAFRDNRYIKIDGKLLFVVYNPENIPDVQEFIDCWNMLARKNNIGEFYFVAYYSYGKKELCSIDDFPYSLFKEKIYGMLPILESQVVSSFHHKVRRYIRKIISLVFNVPAFNFDYEAACQKLIPPIDNRNDIIPEIISGFDHSPRTGRMRIILTEFTPEKFRKHIRDMLSCVSNRNCNSTSLVFLKSWNEWGEGNYIEPDLKWGHAFLDVLREEINKSTVF